MARKSQAMMSIASQLVWGGQGFATFLIATRLLPQTEVGFVVIGNAILFGFQCLLLGPVTNPTLRFGAVSRRSLRATYSLYLAVTALVCAAFILAASPICWLAGNDPGLLTLIRFLSVPFATTSLYSVQKIVMFARERYKTALQMDILFTATNIASLFLLCGWSSHTSAISFYIARSSAALVGLFPALLLMAPLPRTPGTQKEEFTYGQYFEHSKYSSIAMLSVYGQSQVDTLAVGHFLSPMSAAIYGVAKIFATGMTLVTSGLIMVVLPASSRICASARGTLSQYYWRTLFFAYALLLPAAGILAIFADPVIRLCFGVRYESAVPLVRMFCFLALVLPISSITDAVANGAGWFRAACASSTTGACVGITASLALTWKLGMYGAALAPLLAFVASCGVIASLTWSRLMPRHGLGVRAQRSPAVAGGNE